MTAKQNFDNYIKECSRVMNNQTLTDREIYQQLGEVFRQWMYSSLKGLLPIEENAKHEQ